MLSRSTFHFPFSFSLNMLITVALFLSLLLSFFPQVVEVNVKVEEPGKNNVHNNAFYAEEKLLKSELQAMRDCNPLSARHWIVRQHPLVL